MSHEPLPTDQLFRETYSELRRFADAYLHRERRGHTLQPTALVHEAYLRLAAHSDAWNDRQHFIGTAARVMRQVLVDWARYHKFQKRSGDRLRVTFDDDLLVSFPHPPEILDLDRALRQLARLAPRRARLVELRVFAGLTLDEAALALEISPSTVVREWRSARAWLAKMLRDSRSTGVRS